MRTVIIEDDLQKAERISGALRDAGLACSIDLFRSYQSGLKFLEDSNDIDLVILDMSLPTFDPLPNQRHGRPRPLGGYDIMRKLKRHGRIINVIIVTALENFGSRGEQFSLEQLRERCSAEFPKFFRGAIYYSQSKSAWRDVLIKLASRAK